MTAPEQPPAGGAPPDTPPDPVGDTTASGDGTTTVFTGFRLWSGEQGPTGPEGWLRIRDGRVLDSGEGSPPAADRTVHGNGRHLLPGFVDNHLHLTGAALLSGAPDGAAWQSWDEAAAALEREAATAPANGWLLAHGLDLDRFGPPPRLLAARLAEAAGGRRVLLADRSLHRGAASSPVLRELSTSGLPRYDVPHGRDRGVLYESAFGRAWGTALRDRAGAVEEALDGVAATLLSLGVTRAHEPGVSVAQAAGLARLAARTPLRLSWSLAEPDGFLDAARPETAAATAEAGATGVKVFLDGAHRCAMCLPAPVAWRSLRVTAATSLRDRTAWPWAALLSARPRLEGSHVHSGDLRLADDALRHVADADGAGLLRVHAMGNRALTQAARVLSGRRAVLEHAMAVDEAGLAALAGSGLAVSTQPGFLGSYGEAIRARGMQPEFSLFPLRALREAGVPVAISSDHPCGPLDPLGNLRYAVHRRTPDGRELDAGQALRPGEAVQAAGPVAARQLDGPDRPAGLEPGAPADLVLCDGEPAAEATRAVATYVGGRRVWSAAGGTSPPA
ncbi:amidohydrolase family protein [Streptomyces sp. JJ36]|uniref:amidohydrolase family protein n=1 Tax=Streptomyces sp. JJ36 TaxID=2736645 RepID=UPI001F3D5E1D|nr:amidohydrolase family protein [Streptomyces sp. JJ36]MCF6523520.1 amidohydrolase family protein [Streptomyces sp. JJ36]